MKTRKLLLAMAGVALSTTLFNACTKDTTTTTTASGNGSMAVRMKDTPGDFQQVNVEIQQVSVHMSGGNWIDLPTHAGIYNLLILQNGIDTSLVNTFPLPAGKITQMRLLLGTHNTVMVDSVVYPLTVPSGTETGIKLIGNETVNPNQLLIVKLDFDANASVVASGTTYQLKPTVKVIP